MAIVLFLLIILAAFWLVWRFRQPPVIFGLTLALWVGGFVWNYVITASCPGDCGIRVDLLFVVPVLVFAAILSGIAFIRRV
jgi:hypothetical protein